MSKKTITIVYNTAVYVYKFRMNLIKKLQEEGYHVVVISPYDSYVEKLKSCGVEHYPIQMSQYGMNPIAELKTIYSIWKGFKKYHPLISLHYTIKPNIFGNLAAKFVDVPVINNIAGAGKAFSKTNKILLLLIENLFTSALNQSSKVFFQNNEDMNYFIAKNLVSKSKAERIPGSGVDLNRFNICNEDKTSSDTFQFLFVGRLLKEKGILEYLKAAEKLTSSHKKTNFLIVGEHENMNDYIEKNVLDSYCKNPHIHYLGSVNPDNMPEILAQSDCVVLPSYYREGVPRSLLEAAAMGLPIITTNNVGCKEVVDDGVNGFKCNTKDIDCLVDAMRKILKMPLNDRKKMGLSGRKKMENEFDENIVINRYIDVIKSII